MGAITRTIKEESQYMKFEIESSELHKAVSSLGPIVNFNSPSIGMRNACLEVVFKDKLEIKVFNEYANGSCFISITGLEDSGASKVYVAAKTFFNLCKSFSGRVNISLGKRVTISNPKSSYSVSTIDEEAFKALDVPEIEYKNIEFTNNFKLSDFKTRLNSLKHCLSTDESRMELQHVCFKSLPENTLMVSCDGARGAIVQCNDVFKPLDGCLLYSDLVDSILNISNSSEISIIKIDDIIYIKTYNFILASTVNSVEYEAIDTILDFYSQSQSTEDFSLDICIDPDALKEALSRLMYLTDPETNSIKVEFVENKMILSVEGSDSGTEEVTILSDEHIDNKHDSIFVQGKNLKDALTKTIGQVHWKAKDKESAQFICDEDSIQFFLSLNE